MIDVSVEIEIARPRTEVAAYAGDVDTTTEWYRNIAAVEWKSDPPLRLGSRVAFVARFAGRRIAYTYEIRQLVPGERLVMGTANGPFAMETTYTWSDAGAGTRMTLRNRGGPSGWRRLAEPLIERLVRRNTAADLRRLKQILETRPAA